MSTLGAVGVSNFKAFANTVFFKLTLHLIKIQTKRKVKQYIAFLFGKSTPENYKHFRTNAKLRRSEMRRSEMRRRSKISTIPR